MFFMIHSRDLILIKLNIPFATVLPYLLIYASGNWDEIDPLVEHTHSFSLNQWSQDGPDVINVILIYMSIMFRCLQYKWK